MMSKLQSIADRQLASIGDQLATLAAARETLAADLTIAIYGTIKHIDIIARLSQMDQLIRELHHARSQWLLARLTHQFILAVHQRNGSG